MCVSLEAVRGDKFVVGIGAAIGNFKTDGKELVT